MKGIYAVLLCIAPGLVAADPVFSTTSTNANPTGRIDVAIHFPTGHELHAFSYPHRSLPANPTISQLPPSGTQIVSMTHLRTSASIAKRDTAQGNEDLYLNTSLAYYEMTITINGYPALIPVLLGDAKHFCGSMRPKPTSAKTTTAVPTPSSKRGSRSLSTDVVNTASSGGGAAPAPKSTVEATKSTGRPESTPASSSSKKRRTSETRVTSGTLSEGPSLTSDFAPSETQPAFSGGIAARHALSEYSTPCVTAREIEKNVGQEKDNALAWLYNQYDWKRKAARHDGLDAPGHDHFNQPTPTTDSSAQVASEPVTNSDCDNDYTKIQSFSDRKQSDYHIRMTKPGSIACTKTSVSTNGDKRKLATGTEDHPIHAPSNFSEVGNSLSLTASEDSPSLATSEDISPSTTRRIFGIISHSRTPSASTSFPGPDPDATSPDDDDDDDDDDDSTKLLTPSATPLTGHGNDSEPSSSSATRMSKPSKTATTAASLSSVSVDGIADSQAPTGTASAAASSENGARIFVDAKVFPYWLVAGWLFWAGAMWQLGRQARGWEVRCAAVDRVMTDVGVKMSAKG